MKTNLDADLAEGLKQCRKAYEKFLNALNSLKHKNCIPVYDIQQNEKGEFEAINWRLEDCDWKTMNEDYE